jgi:hypothetical protein
MRGRDHALIGALAASALVPVLGINSAVFWAASVFIDGDHYVDYVYRNGFKDFSIGGMFQFHNSLSTIPLKDHKKRGFVTLSMLHTVEALSIVFIAAELTGWLWLQSIFWGMIFHVFTDLTRWAVVGVSIFTRALSLVEYMIRVNNMKRRGTDPREIYQVALAQITDGSELPKRALSRRIGGTHED